MRRCGGRTTVAGLLATLLAVGGPGGLGGLAACGGDDDAGPPADESPTRDGPGADESPAEDGASAEAEPVTVEEIEIAVDDAELGPLTFDALAAGDPDDELVLLLHGFPETSASYEDILPELAAAGWYAVAPDQRGYSPGARPAAVEDYGVVRLVDDVVAFAQELGADRFHLVGHDWGGGVAWATAAFHPDLVRSLTVLSTPHPNALSDAYAAPGSEQPGMSSYVDVFRAPGSERTFLPRETFVAAFSSTGMPEEKAEAYADVLATEEALGAALNWYRATDFRQAPRLDPTTVPTTYVWGSDDLALGRTAAEGTGDHVEADYEFVELEGANHWLPETEAARVTEAILARLAST